jgi:glycosyltransferase involved in cell wall biosynthesis
MNKLARLIQRMADRAYTRWGSVAAEAPNFLEPGAKERPGDKIRVLWYSDTPDCITGFGNVARNMLARLYATGRYEFFILGINHGGCYNRDKFPYWIEPAGFNPQHDQLGRQKLLQLIQQGGYDIFFSLQDLQLMAAFTPAIKEARGNCSFKWIAYSPQDVPWTNRGLLASFYEADYPVCYTKFSYDSMTEVDPYLAGKLRVIYHGTDPVTFHPLPPDKIAEIRQEYFEIDDDTFLVVNVNSNQWRKDLARTMWAFKLWKDRYGHKSKLYLHCKVESSGGNIRWQAANAGLDPKRDIIFCPDGFSTFNGVPESAMNGIYNAADVVVSTALGEGWGLSCTEAFCTKTPVLMPRNSSLVEMVGEDQERGWLAASGSKPSLWITPAGNDNLRRPLVDIEDFAEKLEEIYQGRRVPEKTTAAYRWAQEHTWDIVCREWIRIFEEASL